MANGKNQVVLDIWKGLSKAYDTVRKSHAKQISKHNLTAPQFGVLEVLSDQGPMPLRRISDELLVTGANITCVVDNLEKEDLVRRVHSKEDRRVILAELTTKGKNLVEKIYPEYLSNLKEKSGVLSENEQRQLLKILGKLSA
ncbi:MAG: MarR family transcriptional regulator [Melioribacteraceae bacterium]|nr:MarR family transcriptional regulator [Melioribacteraceae bacterium]MCO6474371.1 MarR family transcriptional regulator [Melioribacteraceae bacterium]MDD3557261.1 MarR family transcriptional regulator [Melioribacteraceae bacterium]